MAIYGVNFNGVKIPESYKRKFAERLNGNFKAVGWDKGCTWLLQGIAETPAERDQMLSCVSNGHRRLHVVERKTAGGLTLYGVYAG